MLRSYKDRFANRFEEGLVNELEIEGRIKEFKEGEVMLQAGQLVRYIPMLLEGQLRVYRIDDDGDEILVYFLEECETSAMTMNYCLG